MKANAFFLVIVATLALTLWAEPASATTTCHATGNWCQGYAHVSTTVGGVASARCFALRTTNTAPTCTTSGITPVNEATWEVDAGGCITFYYFDTTSGGVPPAAPNKISISVKFDKTVTNVLVLLNMATTEPNNGDSFSFCGTDTGLAGGSPRAGTYRLNVRAIKDNAIGGVGNYDINSDCPTNTASCDPSGGPAVVGGAVSADKGAIRSRSLVSSITRSAYPSGSTFAYGPAGDESITITGTFTQPNGDAGVELMNTGIIDSGTFAVGQAGSAVDIDATTTLAQNFVADQTFPFANSPYVPYTGLAGNAALTGLTWTVYASTGHGAGLVRFSDAIVYNSTTFNIDPRIRMDSDTTGGFASADETDRSYLGLSCSGALVELFNRGENACTAWSLVNARDQYLSRSMTFVRRDAANTVCASYGSLAPTSNVYSVSGAFSTGGTCLAAADATGSTRHILVTNTDQSYTSGTVYYLSSLLFVDAHPQASDPLVEDDFPTEDAAEDLAYFIRSDGMGGDDSDTIHGYCHVVGVRKDVDVDTTGNAVTGTFKNPSGGTVSSAVGDTDATGWTTHLDLFATTPLGTWSWTCAATFAGNSGTDVEPFTIDVEGGGGGETVYTGADPLTIFAGSISNGTVPIAIHSRMLDGEARVGAADSIFVSVFEWPSMTAVITGASVVEVDATNAPGAYAYNFTPPYPGSYLVSANTTDGATDIGAHNVIQTASLLDHSNNSLEVSMTSNFSGLGFDGFLIVLFWIAAILFFSYMGWLVALAFAVPGLLQTVIPELPFDFTTYLLLCLLGFILEVAANKWSWGGYQSGKRRLKIGA